MKPNTLLPRTLSLLLLGSLATSLGGCTSTETGNPAKNEPLPDVVHEGTPVSLQVGLRSADADPAVVGVGAQVTGLWLQVAEVELLTCQGESSSTGDLMTPSSLTSVQEVTVTAPDAEICAIVVRTAPLSPVDDGSVPPYGVGQGAVVEGTDYGGTPFSAVVPSRITSVLTPTVPGLTLSDAADLQLTIEDMVLLEAVGAPDMQPGMPAGSPNVYDSMTAPQVVDVLAQQLNQSFSLVRGPVEAREVLASSSLSWMGVEDLLCASECSLQDRTACSESVCDPEACVSLLMDPVCGEPYRRALHCRVGLSPHEFSCVDGQLTTAQTACSIPDFEYMSCGGPQ